MVLRFSVEGGDYAAAGEAASKIKKALRKIGVDAGVIRRVAIAAYEAEMNIVLHALRGRLILEVAEDKLRVIAEDEGPGIPDVNLAMQEGFSTASDLAREMGFGAGMGLPNMKKCSDTITIETTKDRGTKVVMNFDIDDDGVT
ncbi:MAG: anti-sigma regulatory factor [Firmicutes bacterium]|nr:anti-sigma regulatory factor [Bacillota bacterium]